MARIEISNIGGGGGGGSTTLALTTTGTSGASVLTTVSGGYSLNIPVYQGALSLSTVGTSGASTLVGNTLTIPTYQGQISLTTTGTSGASTFVGNTLNIPTYQGAISLTTTGTSGAATLVGNTLNVPQYSTAPAGSTGEIQYNNAGAFAASANLAWDNSNVRLNIGAPSSPSARLNIKGAGATSGTSSSVWTNSSNVERLRIRDDGSMVFSNGSIIIDQLTNNNSTQILASQSQPLNFSALVFYPASSASANIGQSFSVIPKGSGYSSTIKAQFAIFNTDFLADSTNYEFMITRGAGSDFRLATGANGTGVVRPLLISSGAASGTNTSQMLINSNGTVSLNKTSTNYQLDVTAASSFDGFRVVGSSSASGRVALQVQSSTATLYNIDNDGRISYLATNTAAGTTGAQTINRPSGTVNFAAGATSLVVTNSLCTAASIVLPVIRTNDATAQIKNVVPAAGSFTINLSAAATAETSVGFFIIN